MAPARPWADLPAELLLCITDRLAALRCYLAVRSVCAAWRSALAPAAPFVLFVVPHDRLAVAVSLPLNRKLHLAELGSRSRCVGSSGGWLALATEPAYAKHRSEPDVLLLNPLTGQELVLPVLPHLATVTSFRPHRVPWPLLESKVVFAPNPRKSDEFAAVVVARGQRTLAWIRTGDAEWCAQEIGWWNTELVDVVYHDGEFYCLTRRGNVYVVNIPPRGFHRAKPVLEPMLAKENVFASPYASLSERINAKYLVFCGGDMYQVWRNTGRAFDLRFIGGRRFHVPENEAFVLRYTRGRRSRWEATKDLGGHAVFIGKNNAVSVRAEVAPGLKGDCVYWMCPFAEFTSIEFDLRTGKVTPCVEWQSHAVCWYLLGGMADSDKKNGENLQRQQKRMELGV